MMRHLPSLLFALCLAAPLPAQDIRPQEAARLADFDATLGQALRAALAGGGRGDVDQLQEVMAGTPLRPLATALPGDWRCRTLKLGGISPLTVYAPFDCRITPDGTTFIFEKLTGSQRTTGTIQLVDGQMIFLGVGTVNDDPPRDYDSLHPAFIGTPTLTPQVAVVEQTDPNTVRMLFPAPINESLFDILYLTRTGG